MDETPLSDILNDEPTEAAPVVEAPSTEATERPRDEQGRFTTVEPGDPPAAETPPVEAGPPAAQQEAEPGHIPVKALQDERQKRQQAEDQLRQYEAYFTSLQQPQPQQPEAPDPNVDFAGWLNWRDQQIATQIRDYVMQEAQQYGGQVETNNLVKVSEMLARRQHEDYDEKVEVFKQAAAENPLLIDQLRQAPDPAMYAYQVAGKYLEAKQYGTAAPSRDDLKAEIRAELMAELSLSPKPTAPSSLASQGSLSVPRSGPAWSGPADLGDILNQR